MLIWELTDTLNNVIFNNKGYVFLKKLKTLQNGVEFNNTGDVHLTI